MTFLTIWCRPQRRKSTTETVPDRLLAPMSPTDMRYCGPQFVVDLKVCQTCKYYSRRGPWGEGCLVGAQGREFSWTSRTQRDQLSGKGLTLPTKCPSCRPALPRERNLTRPKLRGLWGSIQHQASQNHPKRGGQEKRAQGLQPYHSKHLRKMSSDDTWKRSPRNTPICQWSTGRRRKGKQSADRQRSQTSSPRVTNSLKTSPI